MSWRSFNLHLVGYSTVLLAILIGFNVLVDPFSYGKWALSLQQEEVNHRVNYRLWKIIAYRKKTPDVVLLGDSRTAELDVSTLDDLTGQSHFNFAYGGGSFQEIIETFWHCIDIHPPKKVIIGLSYDQFNENSTRSFFRTPQRIANNAFTYYTNLYVAQRSVATLYNQWKGQSNHEAPPMTREAFWQHQLDTSTHQLLMGYSYPDRLLREIQRIVQYSRDHGIELRFSIPPMHRDYHKKIREFDMDALYARFKRELASMTVTYDFDIPHPLNRQKSNFRDPYHPEGHLAEQIMQAMVQLEKGQDAIYGRRLQPGNEIEQLVKSHDLDLLPKAHIKSFR